MSGNLSGASGTITFAGNASSYLPKPYQFGGYNYQFDVSYNFTAAVDTSLNIFAVNNNGDYYPSISVYTSAVSAGTPATGANTVNTTALGGSEPDASLNIQYIYGVFNNPNVVQTFTITVVDDGYGNNVFAVDGAVKPPISLVRGGVYTFYQSDPTNVGHPIAFKTTSDVSYTTGVVNIPTIGDGFDGRTVFTVPSSAPDDLIYYCTNHSNMGNTISITGSVGSYTTPNLYLVTPTPPTPSPDDPSISSYSPTNIFTGGGIIEVLGTNLYQPGAQIDFSGTNISFSSMAIDGTKLTFLAPPRSAGEVVDMYYTYTGGSPIFIGTLSYFNEPIIDSVTPTPLVGPINDSNTLITIAGQDLSQNGTTTIIQFGGSQITSFSEQTDTTFSFDAPLSTTVGPKGIIYSLYDDNDDDSTLIKILYAGTFTYESNNLLTSTASISAYNITTTTNATTFSFDLSFNLYPGILSDCSFQLYDVSGDVAIGQAITVPASTTTNSAVITYLNRSIPSSSIYGKFFNIGTNFIKSGGIHISKPKSYTASNNPVSFDEFVVGTLTGTNNNQTVINRTALIQSIITSISGENFGSLNGYISTNLFPFTSDELSKLSFNGINQIRIIVAPTKEGDTVQIAPGNSVGSPMNPFDLSLLTANQGLYMELFNCGNGIFLKKGNEGAVIGLAGNATIQEVQEGTTPSGELPFPYGQNNYQYYTSTDQTFRVFPDGALVSFSEYNIVLGGALLVPGESGETICFHKGTHILTPQGYKPVELLKAGDRVTTTKNIKESILIKDMVKFIGKKEDGALYCLPKDSLKKGKPLNDLYMSADHAYKHNGIWKHMKCASLTEFPHSRTKKYTRETDEEDIEYYHIVIEDYFAHTIIAEGVEVETCFKDNEDGILMIWSCDEKACTPLKCEKKKEKVEVKKPAPVVVNKRSMFSPYIKSEEPKPIVKPLLNIVKGAAANEQKNKKKNMTIWAYNKDLNKNMPLDCNEITLPM